MELIVGSIALLAFVEGSDLIRRWFSEAPSTLRLISVESLAVGCLLGTIALRQTWAYAFAAFLTSSFLILTVPVFWRDARAAPKSMYRTSVSSRLKFTRVTLILWGSTWLITIVFLTAFFWLLDLQPVHWSTPVGIGIFVATLYYVALTHAPENPVTAVGDNGKPSIDPAS
jgi:hypothetical protein